MDKMVFSKKLDFNLFGAKLLIIYMMKKVLFMET